MLGRFEGFSVMDGWPGRRRAMVRLSTVALAAVLLVVAGAWAVHAVTEPHRTTPVYDPPVLAGQRLWGFCSAGFYARLGDTIVLTSSGHCTGEGTVATDPDGTGVRGVFGPAARSATCSHPGKTCAASDINYLVVARDRIPWGHLNLVDLGTGGYRTVAPGTRPLACADIATGDQVEIDGRNIYRQGSVAEKGENDYPEDGAWFPCMIAAQIHVESGDSGGGVLVRGIPAGVTSRSFGGWLGFTPLAEGLQELGLQLCTDPDCGLVPPARTGDRRYAPLLRRDQRPAGDRGPGDDADG
jgi:hypothetical protein